MIALKEIEQKKYVLEFLKRKEAPIPKEFLDCATWCALDEESIDIWCTENRQFRDFVTESACSIAKRRGSKVVLLFADEEDCLTLLSYCRADFFEQDPGKMSRTENYA